MTDREKLMDILIDAKRTELEDVPYSEWLVDCLLANGVTFAKDMDVPSKWISVEDRLPKLEKHKISKVVLAWSQEHGRCFTFRYDNGNGERWFSGEVEQPDFTHWMPLPEPPKEEQK